MLRSLEIQNERILPSADAVSELLSCRYLRTRSRRGKKKYRNSDANRHIASVPLGFLVIFGRYVLHIVSYLSESMILILLCWQRSFRSFLETFVFRYLLNHINTHSNVVHALCSVIGRIIKVSYLTDLRQRKLLSEMGEFFSGGLFYQKVGFEILTEVVIQISHCSSCILFLPLF